MPKITLLVGQRHDPGRVSVFVDGRFAFGLSRGRVAELGLITGEELTADRQEQLATAAADDAVYRRVIRLLAGRDHARAELLRKLAGKGVPAEAARRAVARAEREGYLDDGRFAEAFARQGRDLKKWAPARTRRELRQRGVAAEVVETVLGTVYAETDLLEQAVALARARAPRLPADREARRRRLVGFLERRGFPTSVCRQAVDEVAP